MIFSRISKSEVRILPGEPNQTKHAFYLVLSSDWSCFVVKTWQPCLTYNFHVVGKTSENSIVVTTYHTDQRTSSVLVDHLTYSYYTLTAT